jgi:hypothetical protein
LHMTCRATPRSSRATGIAPEPSRPACGPIPPGRDDLGGRAARQDTER